MANRILRDKDGAELGRIIKLGKIEVLRSKSGKEIGRYDPDTDVTRDASGKYVGKGNLLAYLL